MNLGSIKSDNLKIRSPHLRDYIKMVRDFVSHFVREISIYFASCPSLPVHIFSYYLEKPEALEDQNQNTKYWIPGELDNISVLRKK